MQFSICLACAFLQACCYAMDLKHHNVNNKYLTKEQFHDELRHKNHDLVCPKTWLATFGRSYHQCITAFEGMDTEKTYATKQSIELARRKSLLNDMTDAKAERIVRSSPEWADYIKRMVDSKTDANKARLKLKVLEMRYYENQSQNATARAEMRMG